MIFSKSSNLEILLVVNLSHRIGKSSFYKSAPPLTIAIIEGYDKECEGDMEGKRAREAGAGGMQHPYTVTIVGDLKEL
jgi:hypothetical protein